MQTLQALVGSVIKSTPAGGRIGVCVEPDSTSAVIRLRVGGTGAGITDDEIPYIFHRDVCGRALWRGGHRLRRYFYRLVAEAHGGISGAERMIGAGTTVAVTLPISSAFAEERSGVLL